MSRYDQLLTAIDLIKPKSIVEIGTWCGRSAALMIKQAQKHRQNIQYIGYDLFEEANEYTDSDELNLKKHYTVESIEEHLHKACPGAEINLIKGNTRQTLNNVSADFCYIDGGHSIETIQHDYTMCQHSGLIILDDYYSADATGVCPDLSLYGCNQLVGSLDHVFLLPIKDKVKTGGMTQMAMIGGKK